MKSKVILVALGTLLVWPLGRARPAASASDAPAASRPAPATAPAGAAARTRPAGRKLAGARLEGLARNGAGTSDLLYRMLAYTLVILVLGAAALFVVKKVLPRVASHGGKQISVLETIYLGPKKTLHLLQVGSQRFLVAGSREQISMLGEVTSAFSEQDALASAGKGASFASVLGGRGGADSDAGNS